MHYFSNKVATIATRLRFWRPEVTRFDQIVIFQTQYDEIELKKSVMTLFCDVIVIMSPN